VQPGVDVNPWLHGVVTPKGQNAGPDEEIVVDPHERLRNALAQGEGDTIEFKPAFNDEARETICAFSNTRGGQLWIGVTNDRQVVGTSVGAETPRDWAHRIAEGMGVHPEIFTLEIDGAALVYIGVPEAALKPVWYKGRAWVRTGSTNRAASDDEITGWVLERTGQTWDALPDARASLRDLAPDAIARFRHLCEEKGRRAIPESEPDDVVLEKLALSLDRIPTRAALLLFGREPQRWYPSALVRVGRFGPDAAILDDRPINGTLFDQIEGALAYFREHLATQYGFSGRPTREVVWEYPLEALREAIVNSVCHREYLSGGHVQIRWHDDRIEIVNPGLVPPPLRLEDLGRPHGSNPRNRKIAEVLYCAGLIEQWGSGFERMLAACREAKLPAPEWEERAGSFWFTVRKDVLDERALRRLGLNERQVRAVLHVKQEGRITNVEYQRLGDVSKRTASDDLADLEARGLIERVGRTGRGTYYHLKGRQRGERGTKGANKGRNRQRG
jgi:ATP-dependent DNA helicase RecG